eukprot:CAMPEP_0115049178 /NCGR_PEP_ID=MMETSP0227-20121206/1036_1 /TAXON_ID=89957 /ORGANISM="Polarella glacialis, Strain CCMP 1383" /LENGTH=165 /DNA_ID=CAMNT_0002432797 /DNA_START=83 /DNA_END=577 /DNA_ORIENTATION=+
MGLPIFIVCLTVALQAAIAAELRARASASLQSQLDQRAEQAEQEVLRREISAVRKLLQKDELLARVVQNGQAYNPSTRGIISERLRMDDADTNLVAQTSDSRMGAASEGEKLMTEALRHRLADDNSTDDEGTETGWNCDGEGGLMCGYIEKIEDAFPSMNGKAHW